MSKTNKNTQILVENKRTKLSDMMFGAEEIKEECYEKHTFIRILAIKRKFISVNFSYCIFDSAYFRNCVFETCNFTGCKFINSNLHGSSFEGCDFRYATFDKTNVDNDILERCLPSEDNLKIKLARSLRLNYQQIGDSKSANKAIKIELEAMREWLYKSWRSKERYYRNKYKGFVRLKLFLEWFEFKSLDYIWGNGESVLKLFRAALFVVGIVVAIDYCYDKQPEVYKSILKSPAILLSVIKPTYWPDWLLSFVFFFRLVLFGFFMSIIIKRFNRR